MVVVAHVFAERPAPVSLGEDVLGPSDGLGGDGLNGEPPGETAGRVGFVEVLRGDLWGWGLVHAQLGRESPRALGGALDHDVPADLVVVVGEPVREAG